MKISQEKFKDHFDLLYKENAVYIWGGSGETITPNLVEKLYALYGSPKHNKDYYDSRLGAGRGKKGADNLGIFYPMISTNATIFDIMTKAQEKGHITSLPKNDVAILINSRMTHVAAYLGDDHTIEMRNETTNIYKEKIKELRWEFWVHPEFIIYENFTTLSTPLRDSLIISYQRWLFDTFSMATTESGVYDIETTDASVRAIQILANKYYGCQLQITGEFDINMRERIPEFPILIKNRDGWEQLSYIIYLRLYSLKFDIHLLMTDGHINRSFNADASVIVGLCQKHIRGCVVDGVPGPGTLYHLFSDKSFGE